MCDEIDDGLVGGNVSTSAWIMTCWGRILLPSNAKYTVLMYWYGTHDMRYIINIYVCIYASYEIDLRFESQPNYWNLELLPFYRSVEKLGRKTDPPSTLNFDPCRFCQTGVVVDFSMVSLCTFFSMIICYWSIPLYPSIFSCGNSIDVTASLVFWWIKCT